MEPGHIFRHFHDAALNEKEYGSEDAQGFSDEKSADDPMTYRGKKSFEAIDAQGDACIS